MGFGAATWKPIFVTTHDWGVSYQSPVVLPDGGIGVKLNVYYMAMDEPNEMGGVGVVHRHPVDGALFESVEEAAWFAYEHGFLMLWAWSHAREDRLDEPFALLPAPDRAEALA